MWPSSWKARIRWSGIARPTWMSGEVTSMPSLTRSGRPERELVLELAGGQDVDGVPSELGDPHGEANLSVTILRLCSVVGENRRGAGGGFASSVCSSSC